MVTNAILSVYPNALVAPGLLVGATDTRHYLEFTDNIYRFAPVFLLKDETKMFHGLDERISVENYDRVVRFFHNLVDFADRQKEL